MKFKNRNGSTLALTLIVFAVLMILGTFILGFMVTENKQAMYHQNKTQAYYLARGGAEAVEAAILQVVKDNIEITKLAGISSVELDEMKFDNGDVKVNLSKEGDDLLITSVGKVNGVENKVIKLMIGEKKNIPISSEYAIYANEITINSKNSENPNKFTKIPLGTSQTKEEANGLPEAIKSSGNTDFGKILDLPDVVLPPKPTFAVTDLVIDNQKKHTIYGTESGKDIIINNLTINNSKITIDKKVNLYVLGNISITGDSDISNTNNLSLNIYHYGDSFILGGNSGKEKINIFSDIYIEKSTLNVNVDMLGLYGNILSNGAEININESTNNVQHDYGSIYCPKGTININTKTHKMHLGAILGDKVKFTNSGGSDLDIKFSSSKIDLPTSITNKITSYRIGYFK